jgi:hypothetical protein
MLLNANLVITDHVQPDGRVGSQGGRPRSCPAHKVAKNTRILYTGLYNTARCIIQGNDIHFNYEHEGGMSLSYSELNSRG